MTAPKYPKGWRDYKRESAETRAKKSLAAKQRQARLASVRKQRAEKEAGQRAFEASLKMGATL